RSLKEEVRMSHAVSYEQFTGDPFKDLAPADLLKGAADILQWAYESYGEDIVYACSFGAEGMVLIDLISKVKSDAEVVFLDTDVHFNQTYELIERVKKRYPKLNIRMKKPELTLEEQASQFGDELWNSQPDKCCDIRKVKPLEQTLSGAQAWISGLRREQSASRSKTDFINKDNRFKSVKVCPLIHWTWDDVWQYIQLNGLEYNILHDEGYPSIGCKHCSFA